jgi:small-conductance mechanosensitive channel
MTDVEKVIVGTKNYSKEGNEMSILDDFVGWVSSNLDRIVFSTIAIIIVFLVYKLFTRQITKLKEQRKLEENIAFTLKRVFQWVAGLAILAVVFVQFGIEVGVIAGLLALAGGTILGFAAMNTIGNAIAGIIVMTSRPFKIGDRIFFNGKFADVVAIDLIYTRMKTLDNVLVSVPNQELLKSEIDNYGRKTTVRRSCSITAGYELTAEQVETALLEAASKAEDILKDPKPYVWMTNFGDYAVEYTLYVFINRIKRLPEIDANLRKTVLETCKRHKIDISTPRLIRRVEDDSNAIDT